MKEPTITVRRDLSGPADGWRDQNGNEEREAVVEVGFGADFVLHVVVRHADHPTKSREECESLAELRASQVAAKFVNP